MPDIPKLIREYVHEELSGVYTISLCIVEKVDHERRRAEVSLVRQPKIVIDGVPIASIHASNEGHGEVVPIESGMEGLLFHPKEPIKDLIVESGHHEVEDMESQFRLRDGVLFAFYWNDNDESPTDRLPVEEGDYVHAHPSGTNIWVKESGAVVIDTQRDIREDEVPEEEQPLEEPLTEMGEQGIKLDPATGEFKILDGMGFGIISDGEGNFAWHRKTMQQKSEPTTLWEEIGDSLQ